MPQETSPDSQPWLNPDAKPFIKVQGVTKKFGNFAAVDNVDLEVYKGELFCLLGGSGCGKTTLLRMLAGFETPSSGKITIDGVDMTDVPPYERPVNMMFQSYALFPHMTVEQNVAYGLKRDGLGKSEIEGRVQEILTLVELTDLPQRKPHQLSGGQRQRVALARALVKKPKALLLDEPLAALDKRLREQTQFELMNIQDQLGITFMVVTHDQEEAMTLSTRIAVMDKGRFVQVGTPTSIYEFPETRFIANFIGTANMFEGRVIKSNAGFLLIKSEADNTELSVDYGAAMSEGRRVWVAVRPEKIQISKLPFDESGPNQLKGVVHDIGYLGSASTYRVKIAGGKIIQVSFPNQRRPTDDQFAVDWDDEVYLKWYSSSAVLLTK
jgi:putrescine transport system ATP-binding protein